MNQLRKVITTPVDFITSDDLVKRAQELAKADGGLWSSKIEKAQRQLDSELAERRKAAKPRAAIDDEDLRKAGAVAQMRRMPGQGSPDPDRRLEIGECETNLGRVRVAISRDSIAIHGVNTLLSDIDADLRGAVVTSAASFAAAESDLEQTQQREIIGFVIDAVLRRHQWLTARVREAKQNERYGT
jgi:hypothetical protein